MTPSRVHRGRQFFTDDGQEIFYSEAYGRRPDVPDALRVLGSGATRLHAEVDARQRWERAYQSLRSNPSVAATK